MAYVFNPFTGNLDSYGPILTGTGTVSAAADGTAALPGIAFASDTNTGIYRPGADQLAISTGGNGRLFVNAAGNVGIGTNSPSRTLDVLGGFNTARIKRAGVANDVNLELVSGAGTNYKFTATDTGNLVIFKNSTERVRLDPSGRLLIGSSSSPSGGDAVAENATFIVSGRVGSATDSGRINLQRGSSATGSQQIGVISFTDSSNNAYARLEATADGVTGTGDYPGRLVFSTTADAAATPTERMRITRDGYVRLSSNSGGIQFNGDTAAANALDDYEEGTFTPTLLSDGGVSITLDVTAEGYYRKIGSIVHMWGTIKTTTNLNSANYYQLGTAFTSTLASATHVGTASSSTNAGNANQKSVFSVTSRVSGGLYFVRVSPDYDFSNEDGFSFFISTPV